MDVQSEVTRKALRKITAALEGLGHKPVVIGSLAQQAWWSTREAQEVELLTPSGEAHREAIFSAARGEGLQQAPPAPGAAGLRLRYADPKTGGASSVALLESSTPFHKQVIGRAQQRIVLEIQLIVATCEDVILFCAGS